MFEISSPTYPADMLQGRLRVGSDGIQSNNSESVAYTKRMVHYVCHGTVYLIYILHGCSFREVGKAAGIAIAHKRIENIFCSFSY
jgi:hypothetical protein